MSHRHLQVDELPSEFDALSELRTLRVGDPGRGVYASVHEGQIWPAMPKLERLDVLSHGLTSLAPFRRLTRLRVLYAAANRRLVDISAVRELPRLEVLAVFKTGVSDLEPLSALGIRALYAGFCRVDRLDGLDCPELQRLSLPHNPQLVELEGIDGAAGVRQLSVSGSPVHRIDELASLQSLELLEVAGCPIDDFGVLRKLPRLRAVDLSNTRFSDGALVSRLSALAEVRLGGTPLAADEDAVAALRRQKPSLVVDVEPPESKARGWRCIHVPTLDEALTLRP